MLTLYQLAISHYNEKVRWALDLKGIEHRRVTLIPGLHRLTLRRFGASTTPVVRGADGTIVRESTSILEYLESIEPEPALIPQDPDQRREHDELVRFLDEVAGTSVRAYAYWLVIQRPGALHARWREGLGARQRMVLAAAMPLLNGYCPASSDSRPNALPVISSACGRAASASKTVSRRPETAISSAAGSPPPT
jgi:glutathione S-transferase